MKSIKRFAVAGLVLAGLLFSPGTVQAGCCQDAKKAGTACAHPCCIAAAKAKKSCEKCNPKKPRNETKAAKKQG